MKGAMGLILRKEAGKKHSRSGRQNNRRAEVSLYGCYQCYLHVLKRASFELNTGSTQIVHHSAAAVCGLISS